MKTTIVSIPAEILTHIFESCDDFTQAVALASACKSTHRTWITNSTAIIWSVAKVQIRSFDDALMAVRATAMVLKSYQAGLLPPAVAMNSLSGNSKLPDLTELKEVLNMQHLVRCIEYMYFYSSITDDSDDNLFPDYGRYPAARRQFPGCLNEDIPGAKNATIDSFRDSFYRAIYRLLLAGAVLARVYMAPLFPARQAEDVSFFVKWGSDYWSEDADTYEGCYYPLEADVASIRQFPVYNHDVEDWSQIGQWRNREYETCFGPFASWIIKDGKSRAQDEPQHPDNMPDWAQNQAHISAVKELMLLLVAYDHLNSKFINIRRGSRKGAYMQRPGNRTVSIVRFGIFQIEEVTMPLAVEDLTDARLSTRFHPALAGTVGQDIPYQFNPPQAMFFLEDKMRGFPVNFETDIIGAPAMLELWHFALRHYLNLGFKSGTFWLPRRGSPSESIWWRDVGRGEIFLNPDWAVVQKYKPGVTSWMPGNN